MPPKKSYGLLPIKTYVAASISAVDDIRFIFEKRNEVSEEDFWAILKDYKNVLEHIQNLLNWESEEMDS